MAAASGLLAASRLAVADATRVEGVARGLDANASPPKAALPLDRDVPQATTHASGTETSPTTLPMEASITVFLWLLDVLS